jgi:uncharacterized repeat protein (TIGR01451 family)
MYRKVAEPSVGVVGEPLTFTITVRAEPGVTSSTDRLTDSLPEGGGCVRHRYAR